jgi:caffeoyl-CoA O-methyltransferase
MKHKTLMPLLILLTALLSLSFAASGVSQGIGKKDNPALDQKVKAFLEEHRRQWRDMNVSATDGEALYNLILEHSYTRVLEIGTSTGHSGTWIAWALSKTGGRLTTIDIDEYRHAEAVKNFKKAGLSEYIDARLADAHELVPKLQGPYDFIFADADKEWTTNYFKMLLPKLLVGGCFASHNVGMSGVDDFLDYVKTFPNFETRIDPESRRISLSFKKSERSP